jgi:hypothetical protein
LEPGAQSVSRHQLTCWRTGMTPARVGAAPLQFIGRSTSGNGDCGTSNKQFCGSRTCRTPQRDRREPRCGRPQSPSAPAFAHARASLQTWSGKPGRGGGKCRPAPTPALSSNRSRVSSIRQSLQRTDGGAHGKIRNVQIPGRGLEVTMAKQDLNAAQVDGLLEQMRRETMAQSVR